MELETRRGGTGPQNCVRDVIRPVTANQQNHPLEIYNSKQWKHEVAISISNLVIMRGNPSGMKYSLQRHHNHKPNPLLSRRMSFIPVYVLAVVEAIRLDMLCYTSNKDPAPVHSKCPITSTHNSRSIRGRKGHDIVEPGIETFIPLLQPHELYNC